MVVSGERGRCGRGWITGAGTEQTVGRGSTAVMVEVLL